MANQSPFYPSPFYLPPPRPASFNLERVLPAATFALPNGEPYPTHPIDKKTGLPIWDTTGLLLTATQPDRRHKIAMLLNDIIFTDPCPVSIPNISKRDINHKFLCAPKSGTSLGLNSTVLLLNTFLITVDVA